MLMLMLIGRLLVCVLVGPNSLLSEFHRGNEITDKIFKESGDTKELWRQLIEETDLFISHPKYLAVIGSAKTEDDINKW